MHDEWAHFLAKCPGKVYENCVSFRCMNVHVYSRVLTCTQVFLFLSERVHAHVPVHVYVPVLVLGVRDRDSKEGTSGST